MTGTSVTPGRMQLEARALRIAGLYATVPAVGPARQRVGDLTAHVVAAHAAALERIIALAAVPAIVEDDPDIAEVLWVHRPVVDAGEAVDRYGNRIDALLTALEQSVSAEVAEAAAQIAGEVGNLYGETLERVFELLHDSGQGDTIRAALDDDLVASVLVVHGLHPKGLDERVADCLAQLAETLPEHGGLVRLLGIDADGAVTVEITGGSEIHRWRTRLAVERALEQAAPDHGGIEVLGARHEPAVAAPLVTYIPLDQVRRRGAGAAAAATPRRWIDLPQLLDVSEGAVCRVVDDDVAVVACNVDGDLYVVLDPFTNEPPVGALQLVDRRPPTVADGKGRRLVFEAPLPVQRTDDSVEVKVP